MGEIHGPKLKDVIGGDFSGAKCAFLERIACRETLNSVNMGLPPSDAS